jgi:hypothetical protein
MAIGFTVFSFLSRDYSSASVGQYSPILGHANLGSCQFGVMPIWGQLLVSTGQRLNQAFDQSRDCRGMVTGDR